MTREEFAKLEMGSLIHNGKDICKTVSKFTKPASEIPDDSTTWTRDLNGSDSLHGDIPISDHDKWDKVTGCDNVPQIIVNKIMDFRLQTLEMKIHSIFR